MTPQLVNVIIKIGSYVLNFKSKQDDSWFSIGSNSDYESTEFFVWTDSNEYSDFDISNTLKGVETLAVWFGIDRCE